MAQLRKVSGPEAVKILCNKFGFSINGRTGNHVRTIKTNSGRKSWNYCTNT